MTDHIDDGAPADVPLATVAFLTAKRDTGTASAFPEDYVVLEDTGLKVRVRGLSRQEVIHVQNTKGVAAVEALTIHLGMLEPTMSIDQVKAWQKVSVGGEMEPVTKRIGELSGMLKGARKEALKEMLDDPGAEFPVSPGEGLGDDRGADESGDAA